MTWQTDGNCAGLPVAWFFDSTPSLESRARWLCSWCPHVVACLSDALENGDRGIRGGLTYNERAKTHRSPVIHEVRDMADLRSRLVSTYRKAS